MNNTLRPFQSINYVKFYYKKVVRIYNNGETLNIAWDRKRAAFYYKNVIKIKE